MYGLYIASIWLHLLAVAAWIGGMIFLVVVVVPVIKKPAKGVPVGLLVHAMGVRFRTLGWVALSVLIATGLFNASFRAGGLGALLSASFWGSSFGHTLGMKIVLVALIVLLSAFHDFRVGPRATELMQRAPDAPETRALRRRASLFGRINMLLGIVVMTLGIFLVRGNPF